jgi:hypothetical protein
MCDPGQQPPIPGLSDPMSSKRSTPYIRRVGAPSGPLLGFMPSDEASGGCAHLAMASHLAGDPADYRALDATFRIRIRDE